MFDICYLDPHTVPLFKMPEIKLTYFNIEGKAELIRILLRFLRLSLTTRLSGRGI